MVKTGRAYGCYVNPGPRLLGVEAAGERVNLSTSGALFMSTFWIFKHLDGSWKCYFCYSVILLLLCCVSFTWCFTELQDRNPAYISQTGSSTRIFICAIWCDSFLFWMQYHHHFTGVFSREGRQQRIQENSTEIQISLNLMRNMEGYNSLNSRS